MWHNASLWRVFVLISPWDTSSPGDDPRCSKDPPEVPEDSGFRDAFETLKITCECIRVCVCVLRRLRRWRQRDLRPHESWRASARDSGERDSFHNGWLRKAKIRKLGPRRPWSAARSEGRLENALPRDAQLSWRVQRLAATFSQPCWIFPV